MSASGFPTLFKVQTQDQVSSVKADDVFAWAGGVGFGYEHEKFVYYDGLMPRGALARGRPWGCA